MAMQRLCPGNFEMFFDVCSHDSRRHKTPHLPAMVSIMMQTYGRIRMNFITPIIDIFLCLKLILILFYNFLKPHSKHPKEFKSPSNSTVNSSSPCLLLVPRTVSQKALGPSPLLHLHQNPPQLIPPPWMTKASLKNQIPNHQSSLPKLSKKLSTRTIAEKTRSISSTRLRQQVN